ncbi:MAG: hypothetical protein ACM3PE_07765 [Deltaproteobacteria bacterium]
MNNIKVVGCNAERTASLQAILNEEGWKIETCDFKQLDKELKSDRQHVPDLFIVDLYECQASNETIKEKIQLFVGTIQKSKLDETPVFFITRLPINVIGDALEELVNDKKVKAFFYNEDLLNLSKTLRVNRNPILRYNLPLRKFLTEPVLPAASKLSLEDDFKHDLRQLVGATVARSAS